LTKYTSLGTTIREEDVCATARRGGPDLTDLRTIQNRAGERQVKSVKSTWRGKTDQKLSDGEFAIERGASERKNTTHNSKIEALRIKFILQTRPKTYGRVT